MSDAANPHAARAAGDSDATLARDVMAGNERRAAAELELCVRYTRRVRAYGCRHLGNEDAAADLAQRVLVVLLEKLRAGEVREPERLASFVLGTARRIALAMRRGQTREALVEEPLELPAEALAEAADPVASERLASCFDALGDRERDTLVGTYFAEQSSEQIAAALGVSCDNVRQIRRRAMTRLRQCLGLEREGA